MTTRIPLYNRGEIVGYAVVNVEDAPRLEAVRWGLDKTGGYAWRTEYVRGSGKKNEKQRNWWMHRVIMELGPWHEDKREVDHINRNPLDNRRENLRIVTHAQQAQNRRMVAPWRGPRSSRYRGVSWSAHAKKWTIRVWHEGKNLNGGYFDTEEAAAVAARQLRAKYMPFAED